MGGNSKWRTRRDNPKAHFTLDGTRITRIDDYMVQQANIVKKKLNKMLKETVDLGPGAIKLPDHLRIAQEKRGEKLEELANKIAEKISIERDKAQAALGNDTDILMPWNLLKHINKVTPEYLNKIREQLKTVTGNSNGELDDLFNDLGMRTKGMSKEAKEAFDFVLVKLVNKKEFEKQLDIKARLPDEGKSPLDDLPPRTSKEFEDKVNKTEDLEELRRQFRAVPHDSHEAKILREKIGVVMEREHKQREQIKNSRLMQLREGKLEVGSKEYYRAINDMRDNVEVAKYLRQHLKSLFPKVKFSVKSDVYGIDVKYVDGPPTEQVEKLVKQYEEDLGSDLQSDYINYNRHANVDRRNTKGAVQKARKMYEEKYGKLNIYNNDHTSKFYQILRALDLPQDPKGEEYYGYGD